MKFLLVTACALLPVTATLANDTQKLEQNVFVMGGPMHAGYFSDILQFWKGPYESNGFVGAGYQQFFYEYGSFALGVETGMGLRFGEATSGEFWAGGVARFTTFEVGPLNITPSLTAGFSVVTATIGAERIRAEQNKAQSTFLYYLGPEVAVSHDANPNIELFGRLQHRSGGFGTIANLDGSNAAVVGLRYKF